MKTIAQGKLAEKKACDYLQQQGLKLIEKNYYCRSGEIDLIMLDKQELVFIEVRYRKSRTFGSAAESIDARKRNKIIDDARKSAPRRRSN